jgi:hypothetical protein
MPQSTRVWLLFSRSQSMNFPLPPKKATLLCGRLRTSFSSLSASLVASFSPRVQPPHSTGVSRWTSRHDVRQSVGVQFGTLPCPTRELANSEIRSGLTGASSAIRRCIRASKPQTPTSSYQWRAGRPFRPPSSAKSAHATRQACPIWRTARENSRRKFSLCRLDRW